MFRVRGNHPPEARYTVDRVGHNIGLQSRDFPALLAFAECFLPEQNAHSRLEGIT